MVILSNHLLSYIKAAKSNKKYQGFIDSLLLHVRGGAGGMGYPKFGGIGGQGGNVVLEAREGTTLKDLLLKYRDGNVRASKGGDSNERCIIGKQGNQHLLPVPVGVSILDSHGRVIGELNEAGKRIVVAHGGLGGCSNTGYSGVEGESHYVRIDLKLIADVGLVGFPNAGKSTLLRAITDAKPKIASYPFTTVKPNVGCVKYSDLRTITIADLPGLIEDAHKNVGMGHRFLRHCERTKLLVLVVDINGFQLNAKHAFRSCLETVVLLNKEIELYRDFMLEKPVLLIINKMDVDGAWRKFHEIESCFREMHKTVLEFPAAFRPSKTMEFSDVIPISAKTSTSDIENLKLKLRNYIDLYSEDALASNENELFHKFKNSCSERGMKYM